MKQTEQLREIVEAEMQKYGIPADSAIATMAEQGIKQLEAFIRDTEQMEYQIKERKQAQQDTDIWVPLTPPRSQLL